MDAVDNKNIFCIGEIILLYLKNIIPDFPNEEPHVLYY